MTVRLPQTSGQKTLGKGNFPTANAVSATTGSFTIEKEIREWGTMAGIRRWRHDKLDDMTIRRNSEQHGTTRLS
jgi:hypothetical protein